MGRASRSEFPASLRAPLVVAGLSDSAECTGFVAHRDALAHIEQSTVLLLAGPVSGSFSRSKLRGHIAAKVFEYLGSGRPILYVGQTDCDVEALVERFSGVACVSPGDTLGAQKSLLSLIQQGPVERQGTEVYAWRSLAGRLAQVLTDECRVAPA